MKAIVYKDDLGQEFEVDRRSRPSSPSRRTSTTTS